MSLLRRVPLSLSALVGAAAVLFAAGAAPYGGAAPAAGAPAVAAVAAVAAPATTPPPWELLCIGGNLNPPGFELENYWHDTCGQCRTAGEAGIADGRWVEYRCVGAPVGLDFTYPLYVRR